MPYRFRHMEFVRQCLYPKMDVQLISTTEAWAQFAIAGPNSRSVLRKIVDKEYDISNENSLYGVRTDYCLRGSQS